MFDDCLGTFLRCVENLIGALDRVNIGGGYVFRLVLISITLVGVVELCPIQKILTPRNHRVCAFIRHKKSSGSLLLFILA